MGVEDRNRACVEALERYVVACGGSADLVKNWTVSTSVLASRRRRRRDPHPTQATVETRKEGDTAGTYDVYYFDPAGKRYRSRAEVARAFFLAVPQRRTKAASTFGRTKKGRRRAAHAKRFAACTQHLRAALGRVLDDEQEAVDPAVLRKQHAEADDRGSKSVAAANSKAERLLQKLEESREKEAGARGRLAQATENLKETPLPEASPELLAAVHKAENQPPGSVPIHETDLQLAYRIEQYQAARDRRQCCLNDIEREGRVATRLGECTLKLVRTQRDFRPFPTLNLRRRRLHETTSPRWRRHDHTRVHNVSRRRPCHTGRALPGSETSRREARPAGGGAQGEAQGEGARRLAEVESS